MMYMVCFGAGVVMGIVLVLLWAMCAVNHVNEDKSFPME